MKLQLLNDSFNYVKNVDEYMKVFHDFLRVGKFKIPVCVTCKTKIWPPSDICKNCYSKTIRMLKIPLEGRLIQNSESFIGRAKNFGLVEISGIRIIGILNDDEMRPGDRVKLIKCGVDENDSPYYIFSHI